MSDKNSANALFNLVKTIVDNYMTARKPTAILLGSYSGSSVMVGSLPLPMSMIMGNAKEKLKAGDKVRLLRGDGGKEYYILEIIGRPYLMASEEEKEE